MTNKITTTSKVGFLTHRDYKYEGYNQYMGSADYFFIEGQKDMNEKVQNALVDLCLENEGKVSPKQVINAVGDLKREIPHKLKTPNYQSYPVDFGEKEVA